MSEAAAAASEYQIGSDPRRIEQVPVVSLIVDPNKQREIRNTRKCQDRAMHWDWTKAEAATVAPSRTEAGMYDVIEGQHRIVSLKMAIDLGLAPEDLTFPCFVLSGLSEAQQAQLGVEIPRSRTGHTALEKWNQDLRGGRPHQVMTEHVLAEHGLSFSQTPSSIAITCVAGVEKLVTRFDARTGSDFFDQTLTVLETAYPDGHLSSVARWQRHLLEVVYDLIVTNAEHLDHDRLAAKLSLMPAESWVELGRGPRGGGVTAIRDELVKRYNLNLRTRRI